MLDQFPVKFSGNTWPRPYACHAHNNKPHRVHLWRAITWKNCCFQSPDVMVIDMPAKSYDQLLIENYPDPDRTAIRWIKCRGSTIPMRGLEQLRSSKGFPYAEQGTSGIWLTSHVGMSENFQDMLILVHQMLRLSFRLLVWSLGYRRHTKPTWPHDRSKLRQYLPLQGLEDSLWSIWVPCT